MIINQYVKRFVRGLVTGDDSVIDTAFASMCQSVMTKIENSVSKQWIVKAIVEHDTNIFECYYRPK